MKKQTGRAGRALLLSAVLLAALAAPGALAAENTITVSTAEELAAEIAGIWRKA